MLILVLGSSCEVNGLRRIKGNGELARQERSISAFSRLSVSGNMQVYISQESSPSVRIETDENLIKYIEVENDGEQLRVRVKKGYNLAPRKGIRVFVSGPDFEKISISGSGDVTSKGKINGDHIDVRIAGSGDARIEVDAPHVTSEIAGSGSVRLAGQTETFDSRIDGSGEVYAFDLLSEDTKIRISGSGDAEVFASKHLDVRIAGSGDVSYKGTGSVSQKIAGAGNVRKVD